MPTSKIKLADRSEVVVPVDARSQKQILDGLRWKLERYKKKPELRASVAAVLRGEPFAGPGKRYQTLLSLTNLIAIIEPFQDPDLLAQVLAPSVAAMFAATPKDPPKDLREAARMISYGQDYGRRRFAGEQQAAQSMLATLTRLAKPRIP